MGRADYGAKTSVYRDFFSEWKEIEMPMVPTAGLANNEICPDPHHLSVQTDVFNIYPPVTVHKTNTRA